MLGVLGMKEVAQNPIPIFHETGIYRWFVVCQALCLALGVLQ